MRYIYFHWKKLLLAGVLWFLSCLFALGKAYLPGGFSLVACSRNDVWENDIVLATDTLASSLIRQFKQFSAHESGVVAQVLDAKDIERRGARQLNEVVRTMAGVSVKDYGGIGGLKTVSVRNMGASHTGVCYDGFAITDAQNGQVDISRFMLDNVSSITITDGPSDDIFLSARLQGAASTLSINTFSSLDWNLSNGGYADLPKKFDASAALTGGCFGTWNPVLHLGFRPAGNSLLTADVNYLHSDGEYPFILKNGNETTKMYRLNSDVNSVSGELNYRTSLGESSSLTTKASYFQSERGLPGSVILYYQNPTERLYDRNCAAYAKYRLKNDNGWKADINASYTNAWNRYINTSATASEDSRYLQQEAYLSAVGGWEGSGCGKDASPKSGKFGISLAEDLFTNILDSDIPECPFPVRLSSLTALSAKYSTQRLQITGTLLTTFLKEWLREDVNGIIAPEPMLRVSPSVSFSYYLAKDKSLIIRAFLKESYRVPTFNDLYYSRVGNTSLSPEKAYQANIGTSWKQYFPINGLGINLTADIYCNYIKDKITAIPTLFIWKMRNIGKVVMAGADITAGVLWEMTTDFSIHADANFSYQYAVDITNPEAKNYRHQIPYTPRYCGNILLSADTPWFSAAYTLSAVGKRYALAQNIESNLIRGYADHGISVGKTFNLRQVKLRASLDALNLGGQNYEIIRGYPMSGRSFRITIKIAY